MSLFQKLKEFGKPTASPARALVPLAAIAAFAMVAKESIFYAEPGYVYHVRTITGQEHAVSDVGYQFYLWGRWNAWKRAMTVQSVTGAQEDLACEYCDHFRYRQG